MRSKAIIIISLLLAIFLLPLGRDVVALDFYDYVRLGITPIPCKNGAMNERGLPESAGGVCTIPLPGTGEPTFDSFYKKDEPDKWGDSYNKYKSNILNDISNLPEGCATTFSRIVVTPPVTNQAEIDELNKFVFDEDPRLLHYWAEDQDVTAVGKSYERARQFVNWTLTRSAIDQALSLKQVWGLSRNVAISFLIVVTAVFGLAIIVARRLRSGYKFSAQSSFMKIGLSALFIVLSASIVFVLVAMSEVIMKFFIESLGGNDVFNTYFGAASQESNYIRFIGCRDLNIRVKESADTTIFLLKLTNVTYYMMGVMMVLRKILLWFLLLVSPFLPLLLSFPLIRNTGRIWIGVFFQWLFYGPLFALFFGATAKFFETGIPFAFDFSRIEKTIGYIFPTAIIIAYGGPAQRSNGLNNGNYIDTFMEYVIALILWWAVTWFPWWLLRIYRDDCCDGIYAMRNALFGYIDKMSPKPKTSPNGPTPPSPNVPQSPKYDAISPKTTTRDQVQRLRLDNPNVVRQTKTESIVTAMSLRATTLKDIARLETNKESQKAVKQNLALLENPLSASTTTDRQTYLNIRTELFTRASTQNDVYAQRILSSTNRASQTYINKRNELTKSVETIVSHMNEQNIVNLTKSSADTSKVSEQSVIQTTNNVINNITNNHSALQAISAGSKVEASSVKQILQTYAQNIDKPFTTVVEKISEHTQVSKDRVREVLKQTQTLVRRAQDMGRIASTVVPDKVHARELLTQVDKLMTTVSERASAIGGQMVVRIAQLILNIVQGNPGMVSEIEKNTQVSSDVIKKTLESVSKQQVLNATTLQEIVKETGITKEKVQDIVVEATRIVQSQSPMTISNLVRDDMQRVENSVKQSFESSESNTTGSQIAVLSSREVLNKSQVDSNVLESLEKSTTSSKETIRQVLESVSKHSSLSSSIVTDLVKETSLTKEKIQAIILETTKLVQKQKEVSLGSFGDTPLDSIVRTTLASGIQMEATQPVVSVLSNELQKVFTDEKISNITKEILKHTIEDEQLVTTIQQETGLSRKQVQQTLETLSQSPSITDETVLQTLVEKSGVEKVKALQVVREAIRQANAAKSVTAPEEGAPPEKDIEITRMLEDQLEMALNPESQIDQAIPLDPSELDEYEDIRKLWIEQYKSGEVPVSDIVHSRLDWVTQDLEVITNILQKLISKDEKIRQQALDEIGFILPVFLMNNLSAQQLMTYLKAKAAAAREVRVELEKLATEPERELEDVKRQQGPVEENMKHLELDETTGESKTVEIDSGAESQN